MKKRILLCLLLGLCMMIPIQANTKERVTLAKCVDGDTARFYIQGKDTSVRFLAIDAPEYTKEKEPYGKEASELVCDLLSNATDIQLEYDDGSTKSDKYQRTLAWVYADGLLIQKELVKKGLAEVKYLYGDYAYTQELQDLEQKAKQQKLALWSDAASEEIEPAYYLSAGGILLVIAGVFFTKGKRNQKRLIKKGIQQMRKK